MLQSLKISHDFTESLTFALFFLCVYPLSVWFFQRALLPRWQYAWVYYLGLVLLQFFPALGSFSTHSSTWRMLFVSPFSALFALGGALNNQESYAEREETLVLAIGFHLALMLMLGAVYRWRSRRRLKKVA
ncbi:hypothetical protein ABS71_10785 [bacterium SCN 62-11]|nr:MAG: hypothetical protein ABS71_10785 [bacterium SCN 62-11]